MADEHQQNLKVVNSSGFPFQLRVEEEVERTSPRHGYGILAREHEWQDEQSDFPGFVDLILERGTGRIVIECKRASEGSWLFLINGMVPDFRKIVRLLRAQKGGQALIWEDYKWGPPALESSYCVVRGQGEHDRPMLERIGAILLRSLEAVVQEEQQLTQPQIVFGGRYYLPVIVTNAKLVICQFERSWVNLASGAIPDSGESLDQYAEFREMPLIRFRKSIATRLPFIDKSPNDLTQLDSQKERTIFVVQASELDGFLQRFP